MARTKHYTKDGLTIKQDIFVKELVKTGNATKAALKAYNVKNRETAGSIAGENLKKDAVRTAIDKALEKAGSTETFISESLHHIAQNAKQPIVYEGEITAEYDNHDVRLKALKLIAELKDLFPDKKTTNKSLHLNIHAQYSEDEIKRLLR